MTENKDFARELEARTRRFAIRVIRLSGKLPNSIECKVIRNQFTKAGTSVGANYREANRSRSKADFKSRIRICESEASETQYWLQLITDADIAQQSDVKPIYDECSELLAIFTSIGKKV
jgi:four helix bundle protein